MPGVDLKKLWAVHRELMAVPVRYGLGSKASSLRVPPSSIRRIDCSGHFRYLLAQSTDQDLIVPDGSWIQRAWCEDHGLKQVEYSEVANAESDRLFAGFITPHVNGCGKVGHVWMVNQAKTLESHGGKGVGSRAWNSRTLRRQVHKCFELPVAGNEFDEPPRLFVNGKKVEGAYLANSVWHCNEGALAIILGGTTFNPSMFAPVTALMKRWGWKVEKYTGQLATQNRADIRAVKS